MEVGTAVATSNGLVCAAGAFKDDVKLTPFNSASLKDPKRLFNAALTQRPKRATDFTDGDKIAHVVFKQNTLSA
jgi:hypothetical protein